MVFSNTAIKIVSLICNDWVRIFLFQFGSVWFSNVLL